MLRLIDRQSASSYATFALLVAISPFSPFFPCAFSIRPSLIIVTNLTILPDLRVWAIFLFHKGDNVSENSPRAHFLEHPYVVRPSYKIPYLNRSYVKNTVSFFLPPLHSHLFYLLSSRCFLFFSLFSAMA